MRAAVEAGVVERFRSAVAQRLGLHFEDAKLGFLAEVLDRRLEATDCESYSSYRWRLERAGRAQEELRALAAELTVGETYFFRYADHFRAFAEIVMPGLLKARGADSERRRSLRVLSAGCASGEEAYSLAMVLREHLPEATAADAGIHGIDVNAAALAKAMRGRYAAWSLRETPANLQAKYFQAEGRDFLLDPAVRAGVTFEERNLVDADPLFWQREAFDVVFCRNVIMYLEPEAARGVVARIAESLSPGGFLFLGHAETLRGISQDFHLRHTHDTFYYQRRRPGEGAAMTTVLCAPGEPEGLEGFHVAPLSSGDSWFETIQRASERVACLTACGNGAAAAGAAHAAEAQAKRVAAWSNRAAIELVREERFAEARDVLRELPSEARSDPDTHLLLAAVLTNSDDLVEAESVCREVLRLDELNSGAHYLMALCRERVGDPAGAAEHDRAAIYLDESFAMPHLHLGLVAKRSRDVETARRELKRALALLGREDASRILLFGGGFSREALAEFCRAELRACDGGT